MVAGLPAGGAAYVRLALMTLLVRESPRLACSHRSLIIRRSTLADGADEDRGVIAVLWLHLHRSCVLSVDFVQIPGRIACDMGAALWL